MTFGPPFLRFLAVGLVNTTVGFSTIFAVKALAGWGVIPANVAGYAVGLRTSSLLNRQWAPMYDHYCPVKRASVRRFARIDAA